MPSESDSPHSSDREKQQPEVRYVLAGQPTGWSAMAQEVREFDEEKVKSCKEDIDTLLVFAGLYSAILSAFLVAAYPSLQPDRMDIVIYTLQVIATQTAGYNLAGNSITTSNATLPPLPPFKAADSDIRVNALWFAALIISLITASFAMLVKQWLREFLAVDVPSPQARLRLRHYREPQIKAWMVYEIAASLPLLLQLSLGLFFVGLCYFTASIHSSVRFTTLPLVVGWALLFFAAIALPVFIPSCPYKTTLLKGLATRLQRGLRHLAAWSRGRTPKASPMGGPHSVWLFCKGLLKRFLRRILPTGRAAPAEHELIEAQDKDIDILVSVDIVLANDELLVTTIKEALHYGHPRWTEVADFVMKILASRVPTISDSPDDMYWAWHFPDAFPLFGLRPQVIKGVLDIISEHATDIVEDYPLRRESPNQRRLFHYEEHDRLLNMFGIIMSAADAAPDIVASTPGILDILRPMFSYWGQYWFIWDNWLTIVCRRHITQQPGGALSPAERITVADRVFGTLIPLIEPLRISISIGAHLFQTLTGMVMDVWGAQAFTWSPTGRFWEFELGSAIDRIWMHEAFLNMVIHSTFRWALLRPDSVDYIDTTRALYSAVRLTLTLLGVTSDRDSGGIKIKMLNAQRAQVRTSHYLFETVYLALGNGFYTSLLLNAMLDDKQEQRPEIAAMEFAHGQPELEIYAPLDDMFGLLGLQSFRKTVGLEGVSNVRATVLKRSSASDITLRSALVLSQAAMLLFCLVNVSSDATLAAREIFVSLTTLIRSLKTGSRRRAKRLLNSPADGEWPKVKLTEAVHACLWTIELYERYRTKENGADSEFSEPNSIFPDDLVEELMKLHTTESLQSLSSLSRVRRINDVRGPLALKDIRGLWPDITTSAQGGSTQAVKPDSQTH